MVANKYAFLQITRRRFLNEWEAFKKVISRRNIRRRITIPLTLSNLKLLRRITRTENILHRNFTRRQVAIQNRVASNIGISQRDRKSGSAGMPRPISYAVFCLKKRTVAGRVVDDDDLARDTRRHDLRERVQSATRLECVERSKDRVLGKVSAYVAFMIPLQHQPTLFPYTTLFRSFLDESPERKTSFIEISRGGKLPYKTGSPAISV